MSSTPNDDGSASAELIMKRAMARFTTWRADRLASTDRLFAKVLVAEWAFAVVVALAFSPYGWEGKTRVVHFHVWIAVLLGGAIVSFPQLLIRLRPGEMVTRHVVAVAQTLMSALLIHLSGGRIETHFTVFISLAVLGFYYLDWPVLLTATVTVVVDHLLRGLLWPESVYGISNPEWWRFLEHAFWVVICIAFLGYSCISTMKTWLAFAEEGGMLEALAEREWRNSSVVQRASNAASPAGTAEDRGEG